MLKERNVAKAAATRKRRSEINEDKRRAEFAVWRRANYPSESDDEQVVEDPGSSSANGSGAAVSEQRDNGGQGLEAPCRPCQACGASVEKMFRFCTMCGVKMTEPPMPIPVVPAVHAVDVIMQQCSGEGDNPPTAVNLPVVGLTTCSENGACPAEVGVQNVTRTGTPVPVEDWEMEGCSRV